MLYFYTAYRAEVIAGVRNEDRSIAPGCRRSGVGRTIPNTDFDQQAYLAGVPDMCSFDDFVKYVGTKESYSYYTWTEEGNMWDPGNSWKSLQNKFAYSSREKPEVVYELDEDGKPKKDSEGRPVKAPDEDQLPDHSHFMTDLEILLPKAGFGGGLEAYPPAIKEVANALQNAREKAPDKVADWAAKAGEYARIAHQIRVKDTANFAWATCRAFFKQEKDKGAAGLFNDDTNPFQAIYKDGNNKVRIAPPAGTFPTVDVDNYSELDFDQTLTTRKDGTPNGATAQMRTGLATYFAQRYTNTDKRRAHTVVIEAFKAALDQIIKNAAGCRLATSKRKRSLSDLGRSDSTVGSQLPKRYSHQSHLVPVDIKLTKMNVTLPEWLVGPLGSGNVITV